MSLTTRCPACRTMFKVVPDQLRVSQGWVRCGKCEEIFDASAHLHEGATAQVEPPAADNPDTVPFEGALAVAMAAEEALPVSPPAVARKGKRTKVEAEPVGKPGLDFELEPQPQADGLGQAAVASDRLLPVGSAYGVLEGDNEPVTPAAELSFMRRARSSSRWHRPLVRAVLMVVCLLLTLGLLVQLLVHERDRIVAFEPGLRPLVDEICLLLDCRVAALRQIESVAIDSSAFSKTKGDVYRLSLALKNNAPIDLAMPAVELTLTDTLDQAVLRRVLGPEELGVRSGVIAAASEIQSTLVLTIRTNGSSDRVAGYRLLAFYP